jgi:SET domain-containing protein
MDGTNEIIHHLNTNIKTKIDTSTIHGVGVFAIRDIMKGEELFTPWPYDTGIYAIPNDRLSEVSKEVLELLDMYFINHEKEFKAIRLFKGLNLISHNISYCNSAYPNEDNINITTNGIAIRNIKAGEEILEWYSENIKT